MQHNSARPSSAALLFSVAQLIQQHNTNNKPPSSKQPTNGHRSNPRLLPGLVPHAVADLGQAFSGSQNAPAEFKRQRSLVDEANTANNNSHPRFPGGLVAPRPPSPPKTTMINNGGLWQQTSAMVENGLLLLDDAQKEHYKQQQQKQMMIMDGPHVKRPMK
jgi:hypothetical protein